MNIMQCNVSHALFSLQLTFDPSLGFLKLSPVSKIFPLLFLSTQLQLEYLICNNYNIMIVICIFYRLLNSEVCMSFLQIKLIEGTDIKEAKAQSHQKDKYSLE